MAPKRSEEKMKLEQHIFVDEEDSVSNFAKASRELEGAREQDLEKYIH